MCKIDHSKASSANVVLPSDLLSDLQDAFKLYDRDNQDCISIQQLKNVLHNFGFAKLSSKDYNEELRRIDSEFSKRTGCDFNFVKFAVYHRWVIKGGHKDEAEACFSLFDKRDRGFVNA